MISRDEVLMGRDKEFPLDATLEANLKLLLGCLNVFRELYGHLMVVSSGYRPGHYNKDAGGAKNSNHKICQACDFHDSSGVLKAFIEQSPKVMENGVEVPKILVDSNLYMENPKKTIQWVHLQSVAPKSKKRIFDP